MKKPLDVAVGCPAAHSRFIDELVRVMGTIAMGLYAICALAVAVDWGLESVLPIPDTADDSK